MKLNFIVITIYQLLSTCNLCIFRGERDESVGEGRISHNKIYGKYWIPMASVSVCATEWHIGFHTVSQAVWSTPLPPGLLIGVLLPGGLCGPSWWQGPSSSQGRFPPGHCCRLDPDLCNGLKIPLRPLVSSSPGHWLLPKYWQGWLECAVHGHFIVAGDDDVTGAVNPGSFLSLSINDWNTQDSSSSSADVPWGCSRI